MRAAVPTEQSSACSGAALLPRDAAKPLAASSRQQQGATTQTTNRAGVHAALHSIAPNRFCPLTSSYTQLSTMPEVALQPMVLVRRFWISRTPS